MSSDQILVKKPLIFATGSEIRKDIAESHGISCEFIKSEVDEELIKLNCKLIKVISMEMTLISLQYN